MKSLKINRNICRSSSACIQSDFLWYSLPIAAEEHATDTPPLRETLNCPRQISMRVIANTFIQNKQTKNKQMN